MNPTSLSPSSEHRLFSDASGQVIDLVSDTPQMPLSPRWEPSGLSDRPAMETLRAELCVPLSPGEPTLSPSGISSSPGYQSIVTDFRVFPWGVTARKRSSRATWRRIQADTLSSARSLISCGVSGRVRKGKSTTRRCP